MSDPVADVSNEGVVEYKLVRKHDNSYILLERDSSFKDGVGGFIEPEKPRE